MSGCILVLAFITLTAVPWPRYVTWAGAAEIAVVLAAVVAMVALAAWMQVAQ